MTLAINRPFNNRTGLFSEGPADRRERGRQILSKADEDALEKKGDEKDKPGEKREPTEAARIWMARYSMPRTKEMIDRQSGDPQQDLSDR